MGLPSLARALSHRNFRLYFAGQGISLIGTWMQQAALAWLVYRLTGSPFWLGVAGFSGQVPILFLAPLAGVVTDRWPPRRILLVSQTTVMLLAFLLALLTLSDRVAVGHLVLLSLCLGVVNAFDMTARQTLLAEMVPPKEDRASAVALNSAAVNGARLLGPSLAGLVIAGAGEGVCFLLNAVSYLAALAALLALRLVPRGRATSPRHVLHELKEGFVYASDCVPIRSVLLLLGLVSLLGLPYAWLLPLFAGDILGGGAEEFGLLMASSGCGALLGAFAVAPRTHIAGLGRRIGLAAGLFGVALIGFSCARVLWLSWAWLFLAGFAFTVQLTSSATVLQVLVAEDKRGRVMSFYTMAFLGMAPLGNLLAGSVAGRIGAPNTLLLGGLCCLGSSLLLAAKLPS